MGKPESRYDWKRAQARRRNVPEREGPGDLVYDKARRPFSVLLTLTNAVEEVTGKNLSALSPWRCHLGVVTAASKAPAGDA